MTEFKLIRSFYTLSVEFFLDKIEFEFMTSVHDDYSLLVGRTTRSF